MAIHEHSSSGVKNADHESTIIATLARVRALAFLLGEAAHGPSEFEVAHLTSISAMLDEHCDAVHDAFYGVFSARTEATNG